LDRGDLQAEATVIAMRNAYAIPIALQLFAPPAAAGLTLQRLMSRLEITAHPISSEFRNPARPPPQKKQNVGPPPATATIPPPITPGQQYQDLLQNAVAFDARKARETAAKFGKSMQDLEKMPMAIQPEKVKTKMLPYQLQGLAWLVGMEHPKLPEGDEVRQFWTRKAGIYLNTATN
jgi:SWI/SNF-related matrix-associated actin-dependent regulator of chromatin subfamily A3